MNDEEKELVEHYRKLNQANRANALSNLRVALAAQENTIKQMYHSAIQENTKAAKNNIPAV